MHVEREVDFITNVRRKQDHLTKVEGRNEREILQDHRPRCTTAIEDLEEIRRSSTRRVRSIDANRALSSREIDPALEQQGGAPGGRAGGRGGGRRRCAKGKGEADWGLKWRWRWRWKATRNRPRQACTRRPPKYAARADPLVSEAVRGSSGEEAADDKFAQPVAGRERLQESELGYLSGRSRWAREWQRARTRGGHGLRQIGEWRVVGRDDERPSEAEASRGVVRRGEGRGGEGRRRKRESDGANEGLTNHKWHGCVGRDCVLMTESGAESFGTSQTWQRCALLEAGTRNSQLAALTVEPSAAVLDDRPSGDPIRLSLDSFVVLAYQQFA
ncbi:hypothetical protein MPTK2_2g20010 [Marchantia polymorpha subsp. ruderalis]